VPKGRQGRIRWAVIGLAGIVINGIVGNRADAGFLWFIPVARRVLLADLTLDVWAIALLVALLTVFQLCLFFILNARHRAQVESGVVRLREEQEDLSALSNAISLVEMDDTLLRLLPRLAKAPNREEAIKKVLTELLRDATRVFGGDVSRGMILREMARGSPHGSAARCHPKRSSEHVSHWMTIRTDRAVLPLGPSWTEDCAWRI
jgi:hypothetical protein